MTDEQIKNFRKVLVTIIGACALVMPDSEVIKFCDKLQKGINDIVDEQCDGCKHLDTPEPDAYCYMFKERQRGCQLNK